MTFVAELRDSKKSPPRPTAHFWQRVASELCGLRVRVAFLGMLGVALDYALDRSVTSSDSVLALLCSVLTAAVSATLGLLRDTSIGLGSLFSDHASPVLQFGQELGLCFGEPPLPLDICPEAGPFPALSGNGLFALVACAVLLFGCGFSRQEPAKS